MALYLPYVKRSSRQVGVTRKVYTNQVPIKNMSLYNEGLKGMVPDLALVRKFYQDVGKEYKVPRPVTSIPKTAE